MKNNCVILFTDNRKNLSQLVSLLEMNYDVTICSYSSDSWSDIDFYSGKNVLFVLDTFPNNTDAVWVISKLAEDGVFLNVPILFTCFDAMYDFEKAGFSAFAYDVLPNPFDYDLSLHRLDNITQIRELKLQITNLTQIHTKRILNQANKLKEQNVKMQTMNFDLVELLVAAIESRDLESGQHIKRIRYFTKALTEAVIEQCPEYGITRDQADLIYYASSVHDIGKIAIPDAIMLKPGRLTPEEFEIMKTHTTRGAELLGMLDDISDNNSYFKYCQEICYCHHERWDGKGYPNGIKGDEIPISAQIVAIADCYDALTSHRPYKSALTHEEAVELILTGACGAFSQQILKCFESVLPEYSKIENELKSQPLSESDKERLLMVSQAMEKGAEEEKHIKSELIDCENNILDSYNIIFEADLEKNMFNIVRGDWLRFFPYIPRNYTEFVSQCNKLCHPADAMRFNSKVNVEALNELARLGRVKTRIEFRAVKDNVEYLVVGFIVFKVDSDNNIVALNGAFSIYDDDEILTDIKRGFGVTDGLTGLSLPKQFERDVDTFIKENPNSKCLMIHIDIDDMSMCNNIFGYEYGNALIKEFAMKLRNLKSKDKLVCKAASDKFCLFVKNITNHAEMVMIIEKLHNTLRKPYHTATENGVFTATMGISRYPNDGDNYKKLVMAAEYAAKTSKVNGKNAYVFYNNGMKQLASYSMDYDATNQLEKKTDYEPKFAPVINAYTGDLVSYDYIPFSMFDNTISVTSEVYYELNKSSATRKNLSMLSIKSLVFTAMALKNEGKDVPPLSVYTMLMPDDIPSLMQELKDFVSDNDYTPMDICIVLPQDFLEDISIRRLRSFSEFIHDVGFTLGLYLIGTRYIHNNCYISGIFDRFILTSEYVERLLAVGSTEKNLNYAALTLNNLKVGADDITIPTKLESFEIDLLRDAGSEDFSYTEKSVVGTAALLADYNQRKHQSGKRIKNTKKILEVDKDMFYYDLSNSPCVIMTFDINRNKAFMSPNANDVFGFDVINYFNSQKNVELLTFVHPEDSQKLLGALTKARITLNMTNTDVRLSTIYNRNEYIKYNATFLCVIDEAGTPIRYHCYIHKFLD